MILLDLTSSKQNQISDEATQRLLEQDFYSQETIQEILSLLEEYRSAQETEASP